MHLRTLLVLASSFIAMSALQAEPLAEGAKAPRLVTIDQDKHTVDLGKLYDAGLVLVYFYPKANTSGCTAQACSLRDAYEQLQSRGVTVVGVSTDTVEEQKAFQEQHALPFVLIPDVEKTVVNAFGVPLRGETRASRQAFLVKDGIVVWRDLTASTAEQAADVIAALDAMKAARS